MLITPQHKHCRASFILHAVMLLYHKLFRPPARAQSPITQCHMGGKNPSTHHCILILRISPSGTKCILTSLTAPDRRNLGHLNLQLLKATALRLRPQSTSMRPIFSCCAFPSVAPLQCIAHLLLSPCSDHLSALGFVPTVFSGNLCVLH